MELALTVKQIGIITANFDEYNKWLDEGLKKYQGIVVTEDQIPECKKMRAELNKVEKAINARKVEVKKEFMKPYTEFEEQTKALMKKISDCSKAIDDQIKAFDEREKHEKYERMEAWWQEHGNTVPFERVFDDRLLNKSVTEKGWTDTLKAKVNEFEEDLKLINAMPEEQKAFMADDYVMTLSLQQSLANWQFHVERQKRIEEAMKREAETKEEPKEEPKPVEAKPEEPEEYEIEVLATSTQMEQIKRFLSVQMGVRCTVRVKRTAWDDGLPF